MVALNYVACQELHGLQGPMHIVRRVIFIFIPNELSQLFYGRSFDEEDLATSQENMM